MATLAPLNTTYQFPQVSNAAGFPLADPVTPPDPRNATDHTTFPSVDTATIITVWAGGLVGKPVFPLPNPPPSAGGQVGFPI